MRVLRSGVRVTTGVLAGRGTLTPALSLWEREKLRVTASSELLQPLSHFGCGNSAFGLHGSTRPLNDLHKYRI